MPLAARCTDLMSRKSPSKISAPSARSASARSSIVRTKARTGTPRLSSISETCRPVLPCRPPAAEGTRTGFGMKGPRFSVDDGNGTNQYHMGWSMVLFGTKTRDREGHEKVNEAACRLRGAAPGPCAHPGSGLLGVHGARLCRDVDAGDRNARPGLQARALCRIRQQAGHAGGLHPGAGGTP